MNKSLYWLLISAGKGPEECAFAVYNVVALITAEAKQRSLTIETISIVKGKKPNLYYSTVLAVQGKQAENLVNHWQGTIQWICQSPFRKFCKRKNWFIAVNKLEPLETKTPCSLQNKDIVFETFHASGPGGQHINKTESAVRLLHKPTGTAIVAREWRSQHKNKQSALARLADQLHIDYQASLAAAMQERWLKQGELERGSPVITLVGPNFIKKW